MKDWLHAVELMKTESVLDFASYCSLYLFTTEHIRGYFSDLGLDGKEVLTVASSGDHELNAWLMGAKRVDTFDINRLTVYFSALKKALIQTCDYREFFSLFPEDRDDDSFLRECYYREARDQIKDDRVTEFWDALYRYRKQGLSFKSLFRASNCFLELGEMGHSLYFDPSYYRILQNRLTGSGKFYGKDVTELSSIPDRYDVVLLSNIWDYIPAETTDFLRFLRKLKSSILKPGGKIVTYHYSGYAEFCDDEIECFVERHPQFQVRDAGEKDRVLIYQ